MRRTAGGGARAFTWAGALAYFVAALAWVGAQPRAGERLFPKGSSFDTSDAGLSLARRYLADRAGRPGGPSRVETWGRPLGELGPEADAVVLRMAPGERAGELFSRGERAWVERGGRLVLGLDRAYGPLRVTPAAGRAVKVFPALPGVRRLEPPVARVLGASAPLEAHAVFAAANGAALARWPLGRGEVVLLAVPEALANAALGRADHLGLLDALAGAGRPVYFDEHVHGLEARAGALDLLTSWGLGPALVLLALTGIVLLWRERARLGPPEEDRRQRRTEAVDLLDSLALLYDRALTPAQALRLYRRGLERIVSAHTGLKGEALARRLSELTGGGEELASLNEAYRRALHGAR
ncbi:MAG TPA: DUF4350 domain-containing protein [Vicinamibacteria bacterium]|nr:DUF4350 domain-containing protein [Vicinamibacteria bacterium]